MSSGIPLIFTGCLLLLWGLCTIYEHPARQHPLPGERWQLDQGDPFSDPVIAVIQDVRDGWVPYNFSTGTNRYTKEVDQFIGVFRKLPAVEAK